MDSCAKCALPYCESPYISGIKKERQPFGRAANALEISGAASFGHSGFRKKITSALPFCNQPFHYREPAFLLNNNIYINDTFCHEK
jgi:hypothetical protein